MIQTRSGVWAYTTNDLLANCRRRDKSNHDLFFVFSRRIVPHEWIEVKRRVIKLEGASMEGATQEAFVG
jgi:hypothetical protein